MSAEDVFYSEVRQSYLDRKVECDLNQNLPMGRGPNSFMAAVCYSREKSLVRKKKFKC